MSKPVPSSRLDAILDSEPRQPRKATKAARRTTTTAEDKKRGTFYLPAELLERARNTADALSGPPERLRLNALVAEGLRRELERLERKHNGGEPFPAREAPLRRGRAVPG